MLGQYESYKNEAGVRPGSKTETYFHTENVLAPELDNASAEYAKRWDGVKITLKGGKGVHADNVGISFKLKDGNGAGGAGKEKAAGAPATPPR